MHIQGLIHPDYLHLHNVKYSKTKKRQNFYLDASKAGHKSNQQWAKGRKPLARVLPAPNVAQMGQPVSGLIYPHPRPEFWPAWRLRGCALLANDDIQGFQHGFLAGNNVCYMGGKNMLFKKETLDSKYVLKIIIVKHYSKMVYVHSYNPFEQCNRGFPISTHNHLFIE